VAASTATPENLVVYAVWGGGTRCRTRKSGSLRCVGRWQPPPYPKIWTLTLVPQQLGKVIQSSIAAENVENVGKC